MGGAVIKDRAPWTIRIHPRKPTLAVKVPKTWYRETGTNNKGERKITRRKKGKGGETGRGRVSKEGAMGRFRDKRGTQVQA